jgi:small subunit ribosomal protein S18
MAPKKVFHKKRSCQFTEEGIVPDYKDVSRLRKLVSERGKILPKARTGTSSKYQRLVSREIKRARHLALIPFVAKG